MKRPFFAPIRNALYACLCALLTTIAQAQTCPFDDGNSSLTVEGVILTRYALGITGAPLVANTGINAADAPTVEASISCPSCGLNITGNPTMTVADATIISRKLAGFSGAQLTDGLALGSGTRNTPAAVQSFLLAGCGATGGTVTSITAGSGLTGGTITGSGTIAVNTSVIQNRVSGSCTVGSSIRAIAADGSVTCQTDATGGTGTVTSVFTGVGLSGGPITTTGTVNIDPTYRLPQACSNNQIARYNATANVWECLTPAVVTSVATGPGLVGGPITATGTVGLATTQLLPTTACATNQIIKWNGTAWACASETAVSTAWTQGGNAFGVPGVIGTTDTQEFKIVAGSGGTGGRLLAYLGSSSSNGMKMETTSTVTKPNTISVTVGSASNSFGFLGATVSGGGYGAIDCYDVVTALTNKSCGNSAADEFAVVAGGFGNRVNKPQGTISGGNENTTEETGDTVGGGSRNRAWGPNATVSGGRSNQATFTDSTVSGGALNLATKRGSAVLGGVNNQATAQYATALGRGAVARNYGQFAHASNGEGLASPFAPGNAQYSRMVLSSTGAGFTTNMGARPLALGVPVGDEQMRFLPNQSAFVDATVLAKEPGTSNAMAWTIKCIVMVDSAGTMTLSPSPCVPAVQQQTSALPWTLTTGQSAVGLAGTILTIRQNSPVGIKWVATVNVTEMLE